MPMCVLIEFSIFKVFIEKIFYFIFVLTLCDFKMVSLSLQILPAAQW